MDFICQYEGCQHVNNRFCLKKKKKKKNDTDHLKILFVHLFPGEISAL